MYKRVLQSVGPTHRDSVFTELAPMITDNTMQKMAGIRDVTVTVVALNPGKNFDNYNSQSCF